MDPLTSVSSSESSSDRVVNTVVRNVSRIGEIRDVLGDARQTGAPGSMQVPGAGADLTGLSQPDGGQRGVVPLHVLS